MITLNEISKFLNPEKSNSDSRFTAQVVSVVRESGEVTGYNVSLDGTTNEQFFCRKIAGAKVGDIVQVAVSNGVPTVTGTVGGDTDAKDAQTTADTAQSTANAAQNTAEAAQTSATAASQAANAAQTAANNAQTSASAAQTAANQAITDAAAASTAAGTAQSSANQALANAATAQTAATTAGQAAATAQAAAEAAVRSTDVLWYAKANTTAPAKPSAAVTTDTDTHGAWTKAVPSWDDSYPYYFTCQQFENNTSPATYQWSAVHRDYSITDANTAAAAAQADVDGLQDYFWHDSQGAHVLGGTYRTDIKDGLEVAKNSDGTVLADINPDGATFKSGNGTQIAHLGYGTTQGQSGPTDAPYYDLGIRKPNTTKGAYSVAEGKNTTASSYYSHAEGFDTTASTAHSHAEGYGTTASGFVSHAEGQYSTASGSVSHAEGYDTTASGFASHAEGEQTIASGDWSHAQGKWNVDNSDHADIVGNGTSDSNRSNAYALDWNGNGYFAGDVYVGCNANSSGGTKLSVADIQFTAVSITISNLAADSATAITNYPAPPPDNSGGWTLLGVCGWYTGNIHITAPLLTGYVSGSDTYCRARWRNVSSSTITSATANIRMLWVKTV